MIEPLTRRETEVLLLVAEGLSYKEIAKRLCITETTVRGGHINNIFSKLGVGNNISAIKVARMNGLIPQSELPTTSQDAMILAQRYLTPAQQLAAEGK